MQDITLNYKKTGQEIKLQSRPMRVGRGTGNQLSLTSRSVSRQHALIERAGDQAWITDLGSRNGTFLNNRRLEANVRTSLASGDEVRFGQSMTFTILGCATPLQPTADGAEADRPFGFAANRVDFDTEGVGAEAASGLRDRFRPIQVVSSGGMGKVLLVQEVLSGRFVAMKVMLERALADRSLVQQFIREAVITARLQHPHIIPIHDLGFLGGNQLYYTMSFIDGLPLNKVFGTVELTESIRILRCAALAVSYAHSKGLWHRDLKPLNILVGPLGDNYVIDWGLVSVQPGKEYRLNIPRVVVGNMDLVIPDNLMRETSDALTANSSAGVIGTPLYMAPEQVVRDQQRMGVASDVWAFGVMLFEALAGVHPLRLNPTSSANQVYAQILTERFPAPSEINPTTPDELDRLCVRMLAKEPEKRPEGLGEFIETAGQFLRQHGQAVTAYRSPLPGVAGRAAGGTSRKQKLTALRAENARLRAEIEHLRRGFNTT